MQQTRKEILIVEDDLAIQEGLAELLVLEGFPVITADNGESAIQWLHDGGRPSMIILDLRMPIMDGFGFLEEIQRDMEFKHIPIVVLSGDRNVPQIAADLGIDDHLEKPIDIDKLIAIAHRHC